jgi:hypothetical protein
MDPKSTQLLKEIAQYDWAVEGIYREGVTAADRDEATAKRNALVRELGDHWKAQELAEIVEQSPNIIIGRIK